MAGRSPPSPDPWYVLRGHKVSVSAVAFYDPPGHPPGTLLLSGDVGGTVRVWDLHTKRPSTEVVVAHAHKGILATVPLDDGSVLVHGREGTVSVLSPSDGGVLRETVALVNHDDRPGGLCFCPSVMLPPNEQRVLAIPADDPATISLFDLRARARVGLLSIPAGEPAVGMCMSLCAVGDDSGIHGPTLVGGYEDGSVLGWDVRTRTAMWRSKLSDEPAVAVAAGTTRKGELRVIAGGAGLALHIGKAPSVGTNREARGALPSLCDLQRIELKHAGINSVSIRGDGKLFATAGWDNRVRLFSWPRSNPLAILEYHRAAVNAVAWSTDFYEVPGGKLLAAASKDTRISLWSVYQPD